MFTFFFVTNFIGEKNTQIFFGDNNSNNDNNNNKIITHSRKREREGEFDRIRGN